MKYPELKWIVFCMWRTKPYWEPIAAFNCEKAARTYMDECEGANGDYITYKVKEIDDA